jgi:hypothetical protein
VTFDLGKSQVRSRYNCTLLIKRNLLVKIFCLCVSVFGTGEILSSPVGIILSVAGETSLVLKENFRQWAEMRTWSRLQKEAGRFQPHKS